MKKIILFLLMCKSLPSYSLEVILFGGGGEGKKNNTIFDPNLRELAKKKSDLNLNIKSVFNSGHSETETILKDELKVENSSFTSQNYDLVIQDYVNKIKSGKIQAGESLLIIIETHGGVKTEKYQTHSIAMTGANLEDLTKIEGPKSDSIDKLKVLSDLALSKGIKLGILDFSCHSGNSLILANKNTCVIAASGPNHFAYSDFAKKFYSQMEPGMSLENVFLKTQKNYTQPAFPMISTKAGLALNQDLYSLISPYLNIITEDSKADKLSPLLNSVANQVGMCTRENDFNVLMKQIQAFVDINGKLTNQTSGLSDLVEALKDYKQFQDKLIADLHNFNHMKLEETISIEYLEYSRGSNGVKKPLKKFEKLQIEALFRLYLPKDIPLYKADLELERKKKPINQSEIDRIEFVIEKFEKIDAARKKVIAENPNLLKVKELYSGLPKKYAVIWEKATKVQELVSQMYNKQYQEKKKADSQEACADFTL